MKKAMQLKWYLSMAKLISWLAIPTLLCGVIFSFKAAFQTWALILAFVIPFFGGLLIISKNVWKNQTLAFFHAVVFGISFFTTAIVGIAMDVPGFRELLPLFIGLTVGVMFFTLFSQSIRRRIKELIKIVM